MYFFFMGKVLTSSPLTPRRGADGVLTKMLGTEHIPPYLVGLRNDVGK
mgnify:CR=1 FL=1